MAVPVEHWDTRRERPEVLMAASAHVIDVDESSFASMVVERSLCHPVVVDFWAEWCGPCRALGPVLERLAEEGNGAWTLAKIDTDRNAALAQQHGVRGIPAVMGFVNGEKVAEFTGVQGEEWLRQWLADLAPSGADNFARSAAEALAEGDFDGAQANVQAALGVNPLHGHALVLAAELSVRSDEASVARDALSRVSELDRERYASTIARIEALLETGGRSAAEWRAALDGEPNNRALQWGLAHACVAEGDMEAALRWLLTIVREDRSFREDGARLAMLRLFQEVGDRDPLTRKYRRKLEMTLF